MRKEKEKEREEKARKEMAEKEMELDDAKSMSKFDLDELRGKLAGMSPWNLLDP